LAFFGKKFKKSLQKQKTLRHNPLLLFSVPLFRYFFNEFPKILRRSFKQLVIFAQKIAKFALFLKTTL